MPWCDFSAEDDVVVGFEDPVRQPVAAHELTSLEIALEMLAKADGKKGRPSVHPIEQAKDARAVMQAGDKFQLLAVRIRKRNFRGKIMQQVSARSISAFFTS